MMYRWHCCSLALLSICVLGVVAVGCRHEPAAKAPPTPEQKFAEIARMVKEGIETPGGEAPTPFVTESDGGRSQFTVRNVVTSQLVPPAKPDDAYHGTITVTSQSTYSLRRSAEEKADDQASADKHDDAYSVLDEAKNGDAGVNVLDKDLITSPSDHARPAAESGDRVRRRPNEDVLNIELVYVNDRWEVKSKLDEKTELSIIRALDRALKYQL